MRIYWYWPFARPEELPLACATARAGDEITVHVIDREAAPAASPCERVLLRRDLPDVRRDLARSPTWLTSRGATYAERAWTRERTAAGLRPDVCHLHYLNRFTDWLLPRRRDSLLVMSVHDVMPHASRLPRLTERALLTATYRRADALIVHHERLRQELLAAFDVDEGRVHVMPHQVFAYDGAEPAPLPERPCVLFFGALRANKGVDVLLHALAGIPDEIAVNVTGRGDAGIEEQLRREAAADPRLHVEIGHVPIPRKVELFRQATVVVLPYTTFASQSGVLHDAYAQGRPVIVTDVGALGETVREDGTGLVVPPSDAATLARAIEGLVSDPVALAHHVDRALAVREARSPESLGPRLRELYDHLHMRR
jgi:glycosyltransferase involved in cell wall biosynthesis